jgi:hypothetical protein
MRNLLALVLAAGCYNPDITSGGFACNSTATTTQCPENFSCQVGACINPLSSDDRAKGADGCCVKLTGNSSDLPIVMIPKTGAPYSGAHTDPGLNTPSDCPDSDLEPNDGPDPNGQPLKLPPLLSSLKKSTSWRPVTDADGAGVLRHQHGRPRHRHLHL